MTDSQSGPDPDAWKWKESEHPEIWNLNKSKPSSYQNTIEGFVTDERPLWSAETIQTADTEAVLWKCGGCDNLQATSSEDVEPEICRECGMKTRWSKHGNLIRKEVFQDQ